MGVGTAGAPGVEVGTVGGAAVGGVVSDGTALAGGSVVFAGTVAGMAIVGPGIWPLASVRVGVGFEGVAVGEIEPAHAANVRSSTNDRPICQR